MWTLTKPISRSSRKLNWTKIFLFLYKNKNCSGNPLCTGQRPSCKTSWKGEDNADNVRCGKIISGNGRGLEFNRHWRTEKYAENRLLMCMWHSNEPQGIHHNDDCYSGNDGGGGKGYIAFEIGAWKYIYIHLWWWELGCYFIWNRHVGFCTRRIVQIRALSNSCAILIINKHGRITK